MATKKTIKDEIEELKHLDPSLMRFFSDISEEATEKFIKIVGGRAKSFKVWAKMEETLGEAQRRLKSLESYCFARSRAEKFAFLSSILSISIGGLLGFFFEIDVLSFFEELEEGYMILNALFLALLFGAFANIYITSFMSARLAFLFRKKESISDPILNRLLELYEPVHPNSKGSIILRPKMMRNDIIKMYREDYSTGDISRSLKQHSAFSAARGTKFGFGKGIFVKYKKR